ncbi:GntR family transcriptional regulator [Arthrobacter sp. H41]|uniref:GntR family transcriptional regulator n=1 Tax=Arthrobacter sp. H41 TaxID=1312978 RepID=UPI00047B0DAE|nr:GntR family transcriptional regulator [Arthrobacter sp. H41]
MEQDIPTWLRINPASSAPPYEQLRLQILEAANSGAAPVGTRLPPVRTLAAHLGVATNTVARAYRELEQAQIVQTRGRAGTVIAAGGDDARRRTAEAAADYARIVRETGLGEDDAVAYLRAALRRA